MFFTSLICKSISLDKGKKIVASAWRELLFWTASCISKRIWRYCNFPYTRRCGCQYFRWLSFCSLVLFSCFNHIIVIDMLIIFFIDNFGNTPLLEAIKNAHDRVASLLVNKGALLKIDDAGGFLCATIARGDSDFLKRILSNGIDPNSKDYDHRTPLHVAASEGLYFMAKLLLEAGASVFSKDRYNTNQIYDCRLSSWIWMDPCWWVHSLSLTVFSCHLMTRHSDFNLIIIVCVCVCVWARAKVKYHLFFCCINTLQSLSSMSFHPNIGVKFIWSRRFSVHFILHIHIMVSTFEY